MKSENRIVYTTNDGKTFFEESDAKRHEEQLNNTKAYLVRYAPDLNEKGCSTKEGYIICHANWSNELWVEDWLYQKFGNRVAFVQGVSPTSNWSFSKVPLEEVDNSKLLVKLVK